MHFVDNFAGSLIPLGIVNVLVDVTAQQSCKGSLIKRHMCIGRHWTKCRFRYGSLKTVCFLWVCFDIFLIPNLREQRHQQWERVGLIDVMSCISAQI